MRALPRLAVLAVVILGCVGCDQVTKTLAQASLQGRESVSLLGGAVRLAYVENPGAFLSLGAELPAGARLWLFVVLGGVALATMLGAALTQRTLGVAEVLAIGLLVGGGAGNVIDRLSLGFVRDFVQAGAWHLQTGVFNLADVAITTGTLLLAGTALWRAAPGRRPGGGLGEDG
jgi:signal peptidase II